ncbi:hypothetical protein E2C01_019622 [Portunus trituberculatus]|uniref:Uncharacterized protein n=1 Tax=Portunus trituberculatus TaxID=210409 RepID=A0A5B7DXQ5_PORTR|nr:hypothetical protein [Portunus trituberculatus]
MEVMTRRCVEGGLLLTTSLSFLTQVSPRQLWASGSPRYHDSLRLPREDADGLIVTLPRTAGSGLSEVVVGA